MAQATTVIAVVKRVTDSTIVNSEQNCAPGILGTGVLNPNPNPNIYK